MPQYGQTQSPGGIEGSTVDVSPQVGQSTGSPSGVRDEGMMGERHSSRVANCDLCVWLRPYGSYVKLFRFVGGRLRMRLLSMSGLERRTQFS